MTWPKLPTFASEFGYRCENLEESLGRPPTEAEKASIEKEVERYLDEMHEAFDEWRQARLSAPK